MSNRGLYLGWKKYKLDMEKPKVRYKVHEEGILDSLYRVVKELRVHVRYAYCRIMQLSLWRLHTLQGVERGVWWGQVNEQYKKLGLSTLKDLKGTVLINIKLQCIEQSLYANKNFLSCLYSLQLALWRMHTL